MQSEVNKKRKKKMEYDFDHTTHMWKRIFIVIILFLISFGYFAYQNYFADRYETSDNGQSTTTAPATVEEQPDVHFTNDLSTTTKKVRVAFISNLDNSSSSIDALKAIHGNDAKVLIVLGSFNYGAEAGAFQKTVNKYVGKNFPILSLSNSDLDGDVLGNIQNGLKLCQNDGILECFLGPLHIVLASPVNTAKNANLINTAFKNEILNHRVLDNLDQNNSETVTNQALWRICAAAQDIDVNRDTYGTCKKFGALVVNAYNDAYSRNVAGERIPLKAGVTDNASALVNIGTSQSILFCDFQIDSDSASCYVTSNGGQTVDDTFILKR